jgi:hypothetical protein
MEEVVTLELSVAEVNVILNALGNLPYVQSANLIANIKGSAEKQIADRQAATAETE